MINNFSLISSDYWFGEGLRSVLSNRSHGRLNNLFGELSGDYCFLNLRIDDLEISCFIVEEE